MAFGNVSIPFCPRPAPTRVFGSGRHYSTAASRNRRLLGGLPLPPLGVRNPARRRTNVANFQSADRSRDRTKGLWLTPRATTAASLARSGSSLMSKPDQENPAVSSMPMRCISSRPILPARIRNLVPHTKSGAKFIINHVYVAGSINMDVIATAARYPKMGETVPGREIF